MNSDLCQNVDKSEEFHSQSSQSQQMMTGLEEVALQKQSLLHQQLNRHPLQHNPGLPRTAFLIQQNLTNKTDFEFVKNGGKCASSLGLYLRDKNVSVTQRNRVIQEIPKHRSKYAHSPYLRPVSASEVAASMHGRMKHSVIPSEATLNLPEKLPVFSHPQILQRNSFLRPFSRMTSNEIKNMTSQVRNNTSFMTSQVRNSTSLMKQDSQGSSLLLRQHSFGCESASKSNLHKLSCENTAPSAAGLMTTSITCKSAPSSSSDTCKSAPSSSAKTWRMDSQGSVVPASNILHPSSNRTLKLASCAVKETRIFPPILCEPGKRPEEVQTRAVVGTESVVFMTNTLTGIVFCGSHPEAHTTSEIASKNTNSSNMTLQHLHESAHDDAAMVEKHTSHLPNTHHFLETLQMNSRSHYEPKDKLNVQQNLQPNAQPTFKSVMKSLKHEISLVISNQRNGIMQEEGKPLSNVEPSFDQPATDVLNKSQLLNDVPNRSQTLTDAPNRSQLSTDALNRSQKVNNSQPSKSAANKSSDSANVRQDASRKSLLHSSVEQRSIEQKSMGQRSMEQRFVEPKNLEQRPMEQKPLEQKSAEQRSIEQKFIGQKSVEQISIGQKTAEQKFSEKRSSEQRSIEQKSVQQRSMDQKPVVQNFNAKGSVEQRCIEQNSGMKRFMKQRCVENSYGSVASPSKTNNIIKTVQTKPKEQASISSEEHADDCEENDVVSSGGFEDYGDKEEESVSSVPSVGERLPREDGEASGEDTDDDELESLDDICDDDADKSAAATGSRYLTSDVSDPGHKHDKGRLDLGQSDSAEPVITRPALRHSLFPRIPPTINFVADGEKTEQLPSELSRLMKWKMSPITPVVVKAALARVGFKISRRHHDWLGCFGKHMKSECFKSLREYQKLNHFPGSFQIGRKDKLWRSLFKMQNHYGKREFNFFPQTFVLPGDLKFLKQAWEDGSSKQKWIIKPPASARGIGIRVISKWAQIPRRRPVIVQKYIHRPFLINASKFDMRVYVYVSSYDPLRLYVYEDGLARFASCKYSSSSKTLNNRFMHLTNYSVNKRNVEYMGNTDNTICQGHKWSLKALWNYMKRQGINTALIWETIRDLIIKTIISGDSVINSMTKSNVCSRYCCHELFGFDILLDERFKPWILEVNISPSLHSNSPLDINIKGAMIKDMLNMAGYRLPDERDISGSHSLSDFNNYAAHGESSFNTFAPSSSMCMDKRLFTSQLSSDERAKHTFYCQRYQDEQVLSSILDILTPDDVRMLCESIDEDSRKGNFQRLFPTPSTHMYLRYFEQPRYYNLLLDQWVLRYNHIEEKGLKLLQTLCGMGIHLQNPTSNQRHQWSAPKPVYSKNRISEVRILGPQNSHGKSRQSLLLPPNMKNQFLSSGQMFQSGSSLSSSCSGSSTSVSTLASPSKPQKQAQAPPNRYYHK